jgi:EAL domain-containing protein (putative c-di-GMP-specific phosphodiesterase class I)
VGVEALVRWNHPERGLVGPEEFLPVAEETGLIVPLGAWVVDTACRQVREWTIAAAEQGRNLDLTLAVNLSARQLSHGELVGTMARAFTVLGEGRDTVEQPALCLELRESILTEEPMSAVSTLERLRQLGVRIGIDDFGTGSASLGDVKHLPIDVLKVDRDFVAGVDASSGDAVIVAAVIRLADDLGLTVIAEGVETAEQADWLRRLGCRQAQGFHFSRPQPPEAVAELLGVGAGVGGS